MSGKFEGTDREKLKTDIEKEGRSGKRVLAVAYKEFDKSDYVEKDESDLNFLGYFSFEDPLKETAKEAIHLAKKLGVEVKIITGDAKEVAGNIAKQIGLIEDESKVILGKDLDLLNEKDFEKACFDFSVFARISPDTKFKIVSSLQKKFEVGFLGEGINDVPALKIANVAIVVKEGSDISREVSDIVLLEKDLRVVVDGIKEGRNIFSNINKYIKATLSSNFGNFYSIAIVSLFIPFVPMLPVQILLINLLTDFPLITVATDKVDIDELRKPKLYQLDKIILLIILLAIVSTIFDFLFFFFFKHFEPSLLQTLWFIGSVLTEIVLIFSIRTKFFLFKSSRPSYPLIVVSLITAFIAFILPFTSWGREFFHFSLPSLSSIFTALSLVLGYLIMSEITKLYYFKYLWKKGR